MTENKYDECASKIKEAMDTVYEKKSHKKTSVNGDYSGDTESYPTVQAVKDAISSGSIDIVTSWESTPSDGKVASEKLVKDSLDAKIGTSQTSGLVKNDGSIDTNTYVQTVTGKGLSTNDFSDSYKNKLDGISSNAKNVSVTQVLSSGTKLGTITIDGTDTDLYCNSGGGGSVDIVTSWESTLSDAKVPSEKLTKETIDTKADTNHTHTKSQITDFPTLATVATSGSYNDLSNKPSIPSSSSDLSDGSDIIKKSNTSGLIKNDGTIDTTTYSTFSGSYNDLSNKPSIPSSSSDLSDGSDIIKKSNTSGLIKNDGSIDTTTYISDVSGKEDTSNKVTSWSSTTTDTHYPSEKLTKDSLDGKQDTLVSGTNIKTVNNESLLGSGNITIQGGGGADIVTSWESTLSDTKVPSEKLTKNSIDAKQDSLVSGTNIKTVNNNSLLGSGNITISGGGVDIVTSWESTTSDSKVPSEKLVKDSLDSKINTSNTAGLVKNDGTIDTNTHLISTDIVNDLTTGGTTKVLSAEQGKQLNTLIGNAISYINQ